MTDQGKLVTRERVVEVELSRVFFDDPDGDYVSWHAEWALRDSSSATEDGSEDLAELVAAVLENLRPLAGHYALRLEWTLGGDEPDGATVSDAVARLGVRLPVEVAA